MSQNTKAVSDPRKNEQLFGICKCQRPLFRNDTMNISRTENSGSVGVSILLVATSTFANRPLTRLALGFSRDESKAESNAKPEREYNSIQHINSNMS